MHIDNGVGIYGGLVRMRDDKGRVHEVVKLTYKDGDVVFVSVHALYKISRYKSKDSIPPKINKLGSKTWQTLKNNAKAKVKDIAKELISLYAKRKAAPGLRFLPILIFRRNWSPALCMKIPLIRRQLPRP